MDPNSFSVDDYSLTSLFFNDELEPKSIDELLAVSTTANNFGSELNGSESNNETRSLGAELGDSSKEAITLSSEKTLVAVDCDSSINTTRSSAQRSSTYRGVSKHKLTGKFEANLWDHNGKLEGSVKKGRQVYLGSYDGEENAARAYDLAALKYWGPTATTNFPVSDYAKEIEEMKHEGKRDYITSLRRKSNGFSRGTSKYRGVTRHRHSGKWQARIGRVAENKDRYLGTFQSEEEAAEAYDIAALKYKGANALTNFDASIYDMDYISKNPIPIGRESKRSKPSRGSQKKAPTNITDQPHCTNVNSSINFPPMAYIPYDSATPYFPCNPFHHFHPPTNAETGTSKSSETTTNAGAILTPMPAAAESFLWPDQFY
ncbi:AP2-like ethylene-responsive transcription factor AIL7 [Vicia villosa]|uniref:AP2-like ethylene-responsive transcription factor AIL7 n=1 Tax=Vicia villosa TaxID=3911 RepID=UPI00273B9504|nr:AP2-like ethylene-responsive transcription factor AIL7 [Vicia villosa]